MLGGRAKLARLARTICLSVVAFKTKTKTLRLPTKTTNALTDC